MYDFSKRVARFHDDHITLTMALRADMKKRRDTNKDRIVAGLKDANKPDPIEWINQGGYAQHTMTQPPEGDEDSRYDIDMGVVFENADSKTPLTTKGWVRDAIAVKAINMKNDPVSKPKCVRVVYADGYQCDFPVFRKASNTGEGYELAAGDSWVASDPKSMNDWINERVTTLSPPGNGVAQLRQIIRLVKYFAKVNSYRKGLKFPSGLVATAIAIECYSASDGRLDHSFRETLRVLSSRSKLSPVFANAKQISDDKDVDRIQRLIDSAKDALAVLDGLDHNDCDDKEANRAWKKVFQHSFFESAEASKSENANASSLFAGLGISSAIIEKRLSESVAETRDRSGGSKPWTPHTK